MSSVQAFGSSSSAQVSNQKEQNRSVKQPTHYDWAKQYATIPDPYSQYARQAYQSSRQYAPSYSDFGAAVACNVVPGVGEVLVLRNAYGSLAQTYEKTKELPPKERKKERAIKTGDIILSNVLGALVIPAALAKKVNDWTKEKLKHPKAPQWAMHHPKTMTALALGSIGAVTAKPVNALVNKALDLTYRPAVDKREREKRMKELHMLQQKAVQANVEARERARAAYYAQMKAREHTAAFAAGVIANEQKSAAAAGAFR